ncbi:MAG: bifunctional adenosylcobinamide kinase/adenosylcobinamide-phosphate guanylyltransferase [Patulibacter sp.]
MSLTLALGGVRSGKSAWAEREAARIAGRHSVLVCVCGDERDTAMAARIAAHRARRPAHWRALPLHRLDPSPETLPDALDDAPVVLVDGLGGWTARLLHEAGAFDEQLTAADGVRVGQQALERARGVIARLLAHAATPDCTVIVASEEAGLGVLPLGAGTAAWLDLQGTLNQELAAAADRAVLVVAGRVVELPGLGGVTEAEPPSVLRIDGSAHRPATVAPTADGDASAAIAELAALRVHGDRLVRPGDRDHAVNVDASGPPEWLLDAVAAASDRATLAHYPDDALARDALAQRFARTAEEVVPVAGAAQALWALAPALGPALAACIHPGFTEAEAGLRAHGIPVERVLLDPGRNFELDPSAVPDDADLVVLGNPAAACGRLQSREALAALLRPGRTIVVDEAFLDQVPGEPASLAGPLEAPWDDAPVIVVRSFTKTLAIPGLRAGVALAPPELAQRLRGALPPWPVAAPALAAMVSIATHRDELAARADRVQLERRDLARRLADLPGVRCWPSVTNYLLCHHEHGAQAAAGLRRRGIVVRPCGSFPGLTDDHLRLTARDEQQNAELAGALRDELAQAMAGAR